MVTFFHFLNKKEMLKLHENRKLEEAGKTDDTRYCLYHQNIGHTTRNSYFMKDKIQALIDAKVIQLRPKPQKISTSMATITMEFLAIPADVAPVLAGKMLVVNYNPHNLKQKGLSPIFTEKEEIIWVHLNLLKVEQ